MDMVYQMRGRAANLLGFGAVAFLSGCAIGKAPRPAADVKVVAADAGVQRVAAANTDFGLRMLKQLADKSPNTNIFISPFSVSQMLEMTMNGADGPTRAAMAKTLGLGSMANADINAANGLLSPSLVSADPKLEIDVANAIWVYKGVALKDAFQKQCGTFYRAQAAALDMTSPSAAATINDWISRSTEGKIDTIVTSADITQSSAVLTNAVYFHGEWAHEFEEANTQNAPFYLANGKEKTLPFMSENMTVGYAETAQFRSASLPYGGGRMSFDVVSPKSPGALDAFITSVDVKKWNALVTRMKMKDVAIVMPRFQVSYADDLTPPLTLMGMGQPFGPSADFTPMGLDHGYISKVLHKAILQVDEKGTVAAAASSSSLASASIALSVHTIRLDHPFFCAIRDNATGELLFAGVIRDPETKE